MDKKEKLDLYYKAKKAYFESEPIMGDAEFDALEEELGLENKSAIGAGSTPNYTVKHPFIMGSLSKVQIKADASGVVDWTHFENEIKSYLNRSEYGSHYYNNIMTPKYDGCSFEYYYNNGDVTISTRGDGYYGRDIKKHIEKKCVLFPDAVKEKEFTLRGEVLVRKDIFNEKYSSFTNPRSFVSGILNRKYDDIDDLSVLDDLSIVVYDYRVKTDGLWVDKDWTELRGSCIDGLLPQNSIINEGNSFGFFDIVYRGFAKYREDCEFALDGIVIKPAAECRKPNFDKERPVDCVAVKFLPTIKETVVNKIEWQLGKTGEFVPVIVFDEIILDGKKVNKASGHNYGYIVEKKISEGSRIKISLAGDIIPFIYDVVSSADDFVAPVIEGCHVDGCHLMKDLSVLEKMEIDFIASCRSLNISGVGDKQAKQIFDSLEYKVDHIFFVTDEQIMKALDRGESKTAMNALEAIADCKAKKNLADVIASMNIKDCGVKASEQCARYLIDSSLVDFSGLSSVGWKWVIDACLPFDPDNEAHGRLYKLMSLLRHKDGSEEGHELDRYRNDYTVSDIDSIKVMLTGSPSHYKNKKEFLLKNPEYKETTKWSECKIVFAGDINGSSSKLVKARKLDIEIREY